MRRTENSFYLLLATQLLLLTSDHILIYKKNKKEKKLSFLFINQKSWTSQSFSARHFNLILGAQKRIHPALHIKGFLTARES